MASVDCSTQQATGRPELGDHSVVGDGDRFIGTNGQDAVAVSASVRIPQRDGRGGPKEQPLWDGKPVNGKVQVAPAVPHHVMQRLPEGDRGAATLVEGDLGFSALDIKHAVQQARARTGELAAGASEREHALALARELDAQLGAVAVDQELMMASMLPHEAPADDLLALDSSERSPISSDRGDAAVVVDQDEQEAEEPLADLESGPTSGSVRSARRAFAVVVGAAAVAAVVLAARSCATDISAHTPDAVAAQPAASAVADPTNLLVPAAASVSPSAALASPTTSASDPPAVPSATASVPPAAGRVPARTVTPRPPPRPSFPAPSAIEPPPPPATAPTTLWPAPVRPKPSPKPASTAFLPHRQK